MHGLAVAASGKRATVFFLPGVCVTLSWQGGGGVGGGSKLAVTGLSGKKKNPIVATLIMNSQLTFHVVKETPSSLTGKSMLPFAATGKKKINNGSARLLLASECFECGEECVCVCVRAVQMSARRR